MKKIRLVLCFKTGTPKTCMFDDVGIYCKVCERWVHADGFHKVIYDDGSFKGGYMKDRTLKEFAEKFDERYNVIKISLRDFKGPFENKNKIYKALKEIRTLNNALMLELQKANKS